MKSGILTGSVASFSSGTENLTLLHKLVKKPGQKLVIFARKWELRKRQYDVDALFKLRSERWNGMYQSAPGRTRNLNSRPAHVQFTSKLRTLSQSSEVHGRDLCTLRILVHKYKLGEVD
jgi:hypothetical protein